MSKEISVNVTFKVPSCDVTDDDIREYIETALAGERGFRRQDDPMFSFDPSTISKIVIARNEK